MIPISIDSGRFSSSSTKPYEELNKQEIFLAAEARPAPQDRAYMNGDLSSHQSPTKGIAHPSFLAELRCPVLAIADFPLDSPR